VNRFSEKVSFIWSVADILRGDYKQSEYGRVILPLTVLRRLDQVLAPTRQAVLEAAERFAESPEDFRERRLLKASGQGFYNTSRLDFERLLADPNHIAQNLVGYINGFSKNARDIVENFRLETQIERLDQADILFLVLQKFAAMDLHPDRVSNLEMGYVFEELIRKFAEQSNETAGEHFTPREVIRLMVNLLFVEDDDALRKPGIVRTMYDPACGTGGMLSVAEEYLAELNPDARLQVFGQELNPESYAICKADMLVKGQQADSIKGPANSFSDDLHPALKVDYLISNPPFGVDWSKAAKVVRDEHEQRGHAGRFGPGLPRKNDGSLLFLLHMLSKMKPASQGGSRLAIVFNGSPLFTGAAASGESEIRRFLMENDLLEAIVALPDQMFYNTGINTYIWVVTNRKPAHRRGKVQLVNGADLFQKMRKSLGNKRKELGEDHIVELTGLFADFAEGPRCMIFDNEDFGFHRIRVERPLQLAFQASPERIAGLQDERTWQNAAKSKKKDPAKKAAEVAAGKALQAGILRALGRLDAERVYLDRAAFRKDLGAALKVEGATSSASLKRAIESALGARDEAAKVCKTKATTDPDTDLRDYENVPLKEDIDAYMDREVLPHVPDAWVDRGETKVGYEIPFTRHFYEYTPPRPLEVIETEIRDLEAEIQGMLAEVFA
jgi:type I restriction enzyme M protein